MSKQERPQAQSKPADPLQQAEQPARGISLSAQAFVIRPTRTRHGPRTRTRHGPRSGAGPRRYAQDAILALHPTVLPRLDHVNYLQLARDVDDWLKKNTDFHRVIAKKDKHGKARPISWQTVQRALETLHEANP